MGFLLGKKKGKKGKKIHKQTELDWLDFDDEEDYEDEEDYDVEEDDDEDTRMRKTTT